MLLRDEESMGRHAFKNKFRIRTLWLQSRVVYYLFSSTLHLFIHTSVVVLSISVVTSLSFLSLVIHSYVYIYLSRLLTLCFKSLSLFHY